MLPFDCHDCFALCRPKARIKNSSLETKMLLNWYNSLTLAAHHYVAHVETTFRLHKGMLSGQWRTPGTFGVSK